MVCPAPLPADDLHAVLAPFGSSRMLPTAAYVAPDVLAWERQHLFEGGWVCVGRAGDLPEAGSQRATAVGRTGVVLVRDGDGQVRAFANLCRHRGHELLACGATARRSVLQCPYHAWTYDLDGRLRSAPRFDGVANFDPDTLGLIPVRLDTWGGWLFVNVDGQAPPLADHVGRLADLLAPYAPEQLVVAAEHHYELAANWKLVHENYHECYHCPRIHPELCRVTVPTSGKNFTDGDGAWVGGTMVLVDGAQTMSFDGTSKGVPLPGLDEERRRTVLYVGLVPDLLVSAHPDYVLTHRIEPLAPDRTRVTCQWLFPAEVVADPTFDPGYAVEFWDRTNRQDWAAVESVQRGLASPLMVPGILARSEDAVYQFVTMVARAYLGQPLGRPVEARR